MTLRMIASANTITRTHLRSARQHDRSTSVLDADEHIAVKVACVTYQKIIAAYADPNRHHGKRAMTAMIDSIRRGVAAGLDEIAQLGRTLWRRRDDIVAFFDHHASNGPTEAINGRLEALRRNALGFRKLTHYLLGSLLHCGALHHAINAL
jgi:transposase